MDKFITGIVVMAVGTALIFAFMHDANRAKERRERMEKCVQKAETMSDANQPRWLEICGFQYRYSLK